MFLVGQNGFFPLAADDFDRQFIFKINLGPAAIRGGQNFLSGVVEERPEVDILLGLFGGQPGKFGVDEVKFESLRPVLEGLFF